MTVPTWITNAAVEIQQRLVGSHGAPRSAEEAAMMRSLDTSERETVARIISEHWKAQAKESGR